MAFMRKQVEPLVEEETEVWACTNGDCPGWMRKAFAFGHNPQCPFCQSAMQEDIRMLPEIRM